MFLLQTAAEIWLPSNHAWAGVGTTLNDAKNIWDMYYHCGDKFMERIAFFLTFFALSPVWNQIFVPFNVTPQIRASEVDTVQYLWIAVIEIQLWPIID